MEFRHAYLIALIQGLFYPMTFISLYIAAVHNGKVYPMFPYISDTGARKPEGCFFGQILATAAFLTTNCICIRYGLIRHICRIHKQDEGISRWNHIALVIGLITTISENVAGNFGVMDMPIIHISFAVTGTTGGCIYVCIQAWLSYSLYPIIGKWKMNMFRWIMAVVSATSYSFCVIFGVLAILYYDGDFFKFDFTKWSPKDGGYEYHVVSAFSEWILILSITTFISTYMVEFKHTVIMEPEFKMKCIQVEAGKQKE